MKILVLSSDNNIDLFDPFHHCMEKYWKKHPEVIYTTETIKNPYYKTICKNYPLEIWSKRIRETLQEIDDNQILIMVDDCFIRNKVDKKRIEYACNHLVGNTAMFNFEKQFDSNDIDVGLDRFKKRNHGASYEVSIMCGLWDKNKLIKVLSYDLNPWDTEYKQNNCNFDYFINSGDFIIDWGYEPYTYAGVRKGKWCKEVISFFEKEGIKIDYEKRGFYE